MQLLLRLPCMSPADAAFSQFTPWVGESLHHSSPFRQHPAKKSADPIVVSGPQKRVKKGPKRVKKSRAQLDQEMEDYRASAADGKDA
jgi:hypothetical protein